MINDNSLIESLWRLHVERQLAERQLVLEVCDILHIQYVQIQDSVIFAKNDDMDTVLSLLDQLDWI